MNSNNKSISFCGHRILIIWILCLFGLGLPITIEAQTKPASKGEKVFIDHADKLRYDQFVMSDVQIATGRVKFRYKDMILLCDSAYLNDKQNWFKVFGHVDLRRSDGMRLTCERAHYDGMMQQMHARKNVFFREPGRSLRCDSLDYDMVSNIATYFGGRGTLVYGPSTVVADRGDYNTKTHDANFYGDVVIRSPKYRINTPSARGNTETGVMNVIGKSVIRTAKGEIVHTNNGTYNSKTDQMDLFGRSTITSPQRDVEGENISYNSTTGDAEGHGNVKIVDKVNRRTITGDDVVYNAKTGYTEGHGNMRIVDNLRKRIITGDNVVYNAKTGHSEGHGNVKIVDNLKQRTITGRDLTYSNNHEAHGEGDVDFIDYKRKHAFRGDYVHYTDTAAIAYGGNPGPTVKDFSRGDTLFMHADTISMKTFHFNTPQMYREIYGVHNVRAFRTDVQAVCGFLVINSRDSCITMYEDPIVWSGRRQLLGDSIKAYMNDSTIKKAYVFGNALSVEELNENDRFNQISSNRMTADFIDGNVRRADAIGNVLVVYYRADDKDGSLIAMNYTETDTMRIYMSELRKLQKIWMPKADGVVYPMTQIPPDRLKLPNFQWYPLIRPLDKFDIYRKVSRENANEIRRRAIATPPRQNIIGK